MSKLYFLVPDTALTAKIVAELRKIGVAERDIGVVTNDNCTLAELPDTDPVDASDVGPAVLRGGAVGGATGLLAGLTAAIVPGGFAVGGAALAGMVLAGGAFGAWVSGMIGVSVPHEEVAMFEPAIHDGAVLMIVHTGAMDRETIKQVVADHHPQVVFGGEDRAIPPVV